MHDVAAVLAGAGPDVDHVVGDVDGLLVVLDDQDGVAQVAEAHQRLDQAPVVPLVQPDGRLVEHVQHTDEPAADLAGQPDALGLAAGQRGRRAVQVEVVEADVAQEADAGVDLLEHPLGDEHLALGQLEPGQHLAGLADGQRAELVDAVPVDGDRQRQRVEPGAAAGPAGHLPHVALDLLALAVGLDLFVAPLQVRDDALELGVVAALPAVAVLVADRDPTLHAVEHLLLLGRLELLPRHVDGDVVVGRDRLDQPGVVGTAPARPGPDGAVLQRQLGIGHHQLGVDLEHAAQAVAGGTGAVGRVEREVARGQLLERLAVAGPGQVLAEHDGLGLTVLGHQLDLGHAFGQPQRRLDRLGEPPLDAILLHQPVDDHLDGVHLVAGQVDVVAQLVQVAVDDGPGESLLGQVLEQRLVGALAAPHHRRQHLEALAVGQLEDAVDDLLGGLATSSSPVSGSWGTPMRA